MSWELAIISVYIILQLAVGYYVSRRLATEDDYFLAGRKNTAFMVSFSLFATWFGAETCIGSAAAVFDGGLSGGRADPFGYTICLLFFAIFLAGRVWHSKITTLGDLYAQKYSVATEIIAAIILIPSSLVWAAAQIRAMGQIFVANSDLSLSFAITVAAAVVIIYTSMGGLLADVITDVFQGGILIVGLVVLFVAVILSNDFSFSFVQELTPERLNPFGDNEITATMQIDRWLVPILGSLVAQELVSRVSSSKSQSIAVKSTFIAAGLYLIIGSIPIILGLFGPHLISNVEDSEQFLPLLARKYLPTSLYLIFIGAMVSAILSTIDSALLATGALLSRNIVPRILPRYHQHSLKIARATVVISGVIAFTIALSAEGIYSLVETASALGSSGVLVTVFFAYFTNFGGPASAIAALVSGLISLFIYDNVFELSMPYAASVATAFLFYILLAGKKKHA